MQQSMLFDSRPALSPPSPVSTLPTNGSYSELTLGDMPGGNRFVLPILSQLSRKTDNRWLTCVDAPGLGKGLASVEQINARQVLSLRGNAKVHSTELIKRALRAGKSHTVIAYCENLSAQQRDELRDCAESVNCHCLIISARGEA